MSFSQMQVSRRIKQALQEIYNTIFKNKQNDKIKTNLEEENQIVNEDIKKQEEILGEVQNTELFKNLEKNLEYPDFLKSFVESQYPYWIDSAYNAKNIMFEDKDYVITLKGTKKDIAPVDRTNTGEIELSMVYSEGLHQML